MKPKGIERVVGQIGFGAFRAPFSEATHSSDGIAVFEENAYGTQAKRTYACRVSSSIIIIKKYYYSTTKPTTTTTTTTTTITP